MTEYGQTYCRIVMFLYTPPTPGMSIGTRRRTALEAAQQLSAIDATVLERASRVIRVLGHPLRLRLLEMLEDGERNVTELVLASGASQAMVSQQLRILRAERVVGDRRDGPRVFYRITEPKVSRILDCIRECDMPDIVALMLVPSDQEPAESVPGATR